MNTLKIETAVRPSRRSSFALAGALSAACLFIGIGGSYASLFAAQANLLPPLAAGLTVIVFACFLRRSPLQLPVSLFLIAAAAGIGLWQFSLTDGMLAVVNRVSSVLGAHMGRNLARFASSGAGEGFAISVIAALLALGCVWMVKVRSVLIASLLVLPALLLDLLLGLSSAPEWIALMFAGVLLLHLPESVLFRNSKSALIAWTGFALFSLLVFGSFAVLLDNFEIPAVSALRTDLLQQIENTRFGETNLTGGDFAALDVLEPSDESMLEITMSEPESLYLRGFIGSEYHSDGWKKASNKALSDGADLFYWLHQADFYGQTQLADAALLLDESLAEDDCIQISVKHTGESRRQVYTPYELVCSDLLNPAAIGDVQLKSPSLTGTDSYTFISAPNQVKRYAHLLNLLRQAEENPSAEIGNYLTNESHYNSFVYSHFLSLPAETRELIASLLGAVNFSGKPHLDYGEAKQRILEWLEANISYQETTPPRIQDSDFLNEFLKINQCGYDVHYATASTAMMRYFGIPARYVEGYLITPEDAENAQAGVPFSLSGSRAHAWCEIYQDGIGWVPFETTPKYLNLMEQSDLLRSSSGSEDDLSPETEDAPLEENSLDMNEDFHDDFEDEEDPDDHPLPLVWLAYAAMGLLALLILVLLIVCLSYRIAIRRLNRSLRLSDRKKAVRNLYAYLFTLMQEIYGWKSCTAPSEFLENVRADQGEDAAVKYKQLIEICEAAAFDVHGVLEEDYRFVYNYVRKTRVLLRKRASLPRRLKLRCIRHLI